MGGIRKIIHIDMDAFYASVELLDRPELRDLPMIVASDHPRAVVTTANYVARQFGLRSAMSVTQAKKRCPEAICIPPNFEKYRAISQQVHHIFRRYTDIIEPISLDEAYLDVTENHQGLAFATDVAHQIRAEIKATTSLTASAGVAPNKFLAKIASDWNKPDGLFVIKPHQIHAFIQPLPLDKIPGVGRMTLAKLHQMQCFYISDLHQFSEHQLQIHFGKFGRQLYLFAQGEDPRPVHHQRKRQQISKETTFADDYSFSALSPFWQPLTQEVWLSLKKKQLCARGVQIKLKNNQFKTIQHSRLFSNPLRHEHELHYAVHILIDELQAQAMDVYRLIGVGVYALTTQDIAQLHLL